MNHWNKIYTEKKHLSEWPWSEVISLTNKFCKKSLDKKKHKMLELGFGAGANIPFFLTKNIEYYGIEGSENIFNRVKKKYNNIEKNLLRGDFKKNYFPNINFDLIIDRASITHNNKKDIIKILKIVKKKLKKNGYFIGIDWYSKASSDYVQNSFGDYLFFKKGIFKNIGGVYFSNKGDILKFFKDFKVHYLSEKKIDIYHNNKKQIISSWSIVAKKI